MFRAFVQNISHAWNSLFQSIMHLLAAIAQAYFTVNSLILLKIIYLSGAVGLGVAPESVLNNQRGCRLYQPRVL